MLWRPPPPAHIHLACLHRRARHCRRTAPFRHPNRDIEFRSCGVAATAAASHAHRPLARVRPAALAVAVTSPVGGIRVLARPVSGSTCRTQHRANARRRRARTRWLSLPHPTRSSCPPSTGTVVPLLNGLQANMKRFVANDRLSAVRAVLTPRGWGQVTDTLSPRSLLYPTRSPASSGGKLLVRERIPRRR